MHLRIRRHLQSVPHILNLVPLLSGSSEAAASAAPPQGSGSSPSPTSPSAPAEQIQVLRARIIDILTRAPDPALVQRRVRALTASPAQAHTTTPLDPPGCEGQAQAQGQGQAQGRSIQDVDEVMNFSSRRGISSFSPQEVSNLLLALATVYHLDDFPQLLATLLPLLPALLGQFSGQALCNSCWSLTVLGQSGHPAMEALLREAHGRQQQAAFTPEGLCQLWQAQLELQDQGLGHLGLKGQLLAEGRLAWAARQAADGGADEVPTAGSMQTHVAQAIGGLYHHAGWHVEREGCTPDGMFSVDVLVSLPGLHGGRDRLLAVEVDGPSHFMANLPSRYDGSTQLRNRLLGRLKQRGLSGLVLVGHQEWRGKSADERREVLRGKMGAAL